MESSRGEGDKTVSFSLKSLENTTVFYQQKLLPLAEVLESVGGQTAVYGHRAVKGNGGEVYLESTGTVR